MVDILGAKIPVPSFGIGSPNLIWIFIILAFAIGGFIIIFMIFQWKTYNRKIVVFENIGGQGWRVVGKDRARVIKVGDGGEEVLYLARRKVFRTAYGRKMGDNTYWFAIGQDGYWYNVVLGDLDAKMGMLDIEPIDRDMRYMHVAIRKNIQDRYRKQTFMDKYGSFVINGMFLVIMLVGIWFLLDKMADISSSLSAAVDSAIKIQEASQSIVASMNNICTNSASLNPA